jgi:Family of unknown function (DUF6454)
MTAAGAGARRNRRPFDSGRMASIDRRSPHRIIRAGIAATLLGVVPTSGVGAGQMDPVVAARFTQLTRGTAWTKVAAIPLKFSVFHPQGMVRIGDDFYVSAVEIVRKPRPYTAPREGHDRDAGAGIGHLFRIGADGRLRADLRLGEGAIYHPGGIDYDGRWIWVPVAEYRPDSRAIVYRVDPATMTSAKMLTAGDHLGGVVHDRAGGSLIGISWGSRRFYRWTLAADGTVAPGAPTMTLNPDNYLDYQDCHAAGERRMLCAGVAAYETGRRRARFGLGGIDLVDLATMRPAWQVPVTLRAPSGRPMTQNPFWLQPTATGLRAWFLPDDDRATLFAFETQPSRLR